MAGTSDDIPRERWVAVQVAAFPFAHAPFRCEARLPPERRDPPGVIGDPSRCRYHRADWRAIAAISVAALEAVGPDASSDDLLAACRWDDLSRDDRMWLWSLFADPIVWSPGSQHVTNGQHRLCGLRAAGAERVVADTS